MTNPGDIGWKELNYASARVMQDYFGPAITEDVLDAGIRRIDSLAECEGQRTYAANPHELVRAIESKALLKLDRFVLESEKARKSSNKVLNFTRLDYPEDDPKWHEFLPIHMEDGKAVAREMSCYYFKEAPYADNYIENYKKYCGLEQ